MINSFRKFFSSKLGLGLTLGFLILIAFAFASSDVANQATFGGVSGGDRVAVVGGEKIGNAEFGRAVGNAVDQARRDDPTLTMARFATEGGLDEVLRQMVDRYAAGAYAEKYGLRAGENLINSEILQIGAFRGPDGNFSTEAFQSALRQQGLTEKVLRKDLADSLLARQLIVPSLGGVQLPRKLAMGYAGLLRERRDGAVGFIPSAAFAPSDDPTEDQLNRFYSDNREKYIRPERRVIRYATFGEDALDSSVTPTEAEIAARYERDREQYAAREDRSFTQLIVPTQDAANALRNRAQAGASLTSLAREAGFSTSSVGPLDQRAYAELTSGAVAQSAFAARLGEIAEPARSALGWLVVRVDSIDRVAERPLASVRSDIEAQLLVEKRARALADLSARVEEQFNGGVAFSDVAEGLGVEVQTTAPLIASGQVYGQPGQFAPAPLRPAINIAFQIEEGEPQLAEIQRGSTFLIFETVEITHSAAAPLAEIRQQAVFDWRLSEGAKKAREAADRVIERVGSDTTLANAMGEEEKPLPPVDILSINRQELLAQGQRIPPALVLMFSMAEGTTKRLEAPNNLGWFVVDLKRIAAPEVTAGDPLIALARQQLRGAAADELAQQLTAAIRAELGVETNPAAVEAVRRQLSGEN